MTIEYRKNGMRIVASKDPKIRVRMNGEIIEVEGGKVRVRYDSDIPKEKVQKKVQGEKPRDIWAVLFFCLYCVAAYVAAYVAAGALVELLQ